MGFHAEGANVVIFDLEADAGAALAASLGERAMFVKLDVSDRAAWTDAVAQVEAQARGSCCLQSHRLW